MKGVVRSPEPAADGSPVATLGQQYENYLKKECGLSPITIAHHWQFARRFIVERFGDAPICVRDLAPDDISRFLLRHAHSGSPAMAKMMVTALRFFFRYLFLSGQTESDLAGAVPSVPDWRLAELPKYLTPEEVERVVHAYEQDSPAALRNRAILFLLGHESVETTQSYLHTDLRQKEEVLAKVTPLDMPPGRFRPDDELLAFLESL